MPEDKVDPSSAPISDALRKAITESNLSDLREILESGVDPNVPDGLYYYVPLVFAADGSSAEIVKLLLQFGAKPISFTKYGLALIHYASIRGSVPIVNILLSAGVPVDFLSQGDSRSTPLMMACAKGKTDVVRELVRQGSNVLYEDEYGDGAWTAAAEKRHNEVRFYLESLGAGLPIASASPLTETD